MRILITGPMGYVGPILARHLRATFPDAELIGFDSGYFAHNLTGTLRLPETLLDRLHFGDIRNFPPDLLDGVDAVVHLAAISNDPMGKEFEAVTEAINEKASIALAQMAQERGVGTFVFASSCSIYGAAEGSPRREADPLNPLTAYARSKVAMENALRSSNAGQMTVTCLRFATACGMSDRLRLDLVLNDFVASALATGEITVLSDGTPWRPLIDVADMARAIEWAIGRAAENGGRFLVVNAGNQAANYQVRRACRGRLRRTARYQGQHQPRRSPRQTFLPGRLLAVCKVGPRPRASRSRLPNRCRIWPRACAVWDFRMANSGPRH